MQADLCVKCSTLHIFWCILLQLPIIFMEVKGVRGGGGGGEGGAGEGGGGGCTQWPAICNPFSMMCFIDVGYKFLFQVINMHVHDALEKSSE